MSGPVIHFPTEAENAAALASFIADQKLLRAEHSAAARAGVSALSRLVEAMSAKTGQSYKLRALLFSLWNGKAAELNDVLCLDWELRKDFAAVVLGWGFEGKEISFFYDAMTAEVTSRGLWEWFLNESETGGAK